MYNYGASKYRNKLAVYKGEKFDSRKEARRYAELILLEKAGQIKDLRRQVEYELIPAQFEEIPDGVHKRGELAGQPRYRRRCVEHAVKYVADFVYDKHESVISETDGERVAVERWVTVVEDTKGIRTPEYIIKRKLMLERHKIKIKEI